jgi:HD-GYP domain-containing protein (c-di-GMP phosphodiesterase class II)
MGHSLRANLLAMRLAERLDLSMQERRDLYYAALLKDAGSSIHTAAVLGMFDESRTHGWTNDLHAALIAFDTSAPGASWFERARLAARIAHRGKASAARLVELRCERGADIVRQLGLGEGAAETVRTLEEHWDGSGHPRGLRGSAIPVTARVLALAQALEVHASEAGAEAGLAYVRARAGSLLDPTVVSAAEGLEEELERWCAMPTHQLRAEAAASEPGHASLLAGSATMRRVAGVFAEIVDAKSPFTGAHSHRVAELSVDTALALGWHADAVEETRCAALLHDLGKLSVPSSILDKPGVLTPGEWEVMRMHALYTERILEHVQGFEWLAFAAAAHHERLDGRGYCRGLEGDQVPALSRVLAAADVYDALSTARPYRQALDPQEALAIMQRDAGSGFDPEVLEALRGVVERRVDEGRELGGGRAA